MLLAARERGWQFVRLVRHPNASQELDGACPPFVCGDFAHEVHGDNDVLEGGQTIWWMNGHEELAAEDVDRAFRALLTPGLSR